MRSPSSKYLYGLTSSFGVGVNVTQAERDAVDAESAAERRVQAAARTQAERAAFHLLLTHPGTAARLDAMLADNARIDAALAAAVVVELEIVPVSMDTGGVVDVVLVPKKSGGAQ